MSTESEPFDLETEMFIFIATHYDEPIISLHYGGPLCSSNKDEVNQLDCGGFTHIMSARTEQEFQDSLAVIWADKSQLKTINVPLYHHSKEVHNGLYVYYDTETCTLSGVHLIRDYAQRACIMAVPHF